MQASRVPLRHALFLLPRRSALLYPESRLSFKADSTSDRTHLNSASPLSIDTTLTVFKTSAQTPKQHPHSAPSVIPSSDDSTPIASPLVSVPLPPNPRAEASSSRTTIEELEQRDWARYLAVIKTREPTSTKVLPPPADVPKSVPSALTPTAREEPSGTSPLEPRSAITPEPHAATASPTLDLEQYWVSHWSPRNEREGMFDNIQAMFGGGAGVRAAGMVSLGVQAELQQVSRASLDMKDVRRLTPGFSSNWLRF